MNTKNRRSITPEKLQKVYSQWLMVQFPAVFDGTFHPLAMGTFQQLRDQRPDDISVTDLRIALGWYASRVEYLQNVINGLPRLNLDGSVAGTVTAEEIAAAEKKKHDVLAQRQKNFPAPAKKAKVKAKAKPAKASPAGSE